MIILRILPNFRETVYCQTISEGSSDDWEFVWNLYLNESDSQEKTKLQNSLTCVQSPWIIQRYALLLLYILFIYYPLVYIIEKYHVVKKINKNLAK